MSTDPYHAVQQEIQSSLQTAATLRASFMRIRSTAREDSEELVWARNEVSCLLYFLAKSHSSADGASLHYIKLKATLAALEADLEDLEESVK